jgi:16S rRNA (guanine966-N2)-methyltransferase
MTLRIIGGKFRGRLLKSPKKEHIRPTSALLRKAVFDICKEWVTDACFLDLFAGSGAMGIEALSRGAHHATFVDADKQAIHCIQDNLRTLQIESQAGVMFGDALNILERLQRLKQKFTLVYIDPPYGKNAYHNNSSLPLVAHALKFLDQSSLIAENGIVLVEEVHPAELTPNLIPLEHLKLIDSRRYGKSTLHQYLYAVVI